MLLLFAFSLAASALANSSRDTTFPVVQLNFFAGVSEGPGPEAEAAAVVDEAEADCDCDGEGDGERAERGAGAGFGAREGEETGAAGASWPLLWIWQKVLHPNLSLFQTPQQLSAQTSPQTSRLTMALETLDRLI